MTTSPENIIDTFSPTAIEIDALSFTKLRVEISPKTDTQLPRFLGSTLRGSLGWGLKRVTCALKNEACATCILNKRCAYALLFETPPKDSGGALDGQQRIPHPLILELPNDNPGVWKAGTPLVFHLIIIGSAIDHFLHLVAALYELCDGGLGKDRVPFELGRIDEVVNANGTVVPLWSGHERKQINTPGSRTYSSFVPQTNPANGVTIHFKSVTRLISNGAFEVPIRPVTLVKNILLRSDALQSVYCATPINVNVPEAIALAEQIEVANDAQHASTIRRWSNRQKKHVTLHGAKGKSEWKGEAVRHLWPLLRLGEIIHVGKATIFGLGKYEIVEKAGDK
ncbi:MAG: CRISPR system precrRNA processing endoribonuclease RAMP protein Cas6 [Deltaproteobacteria bacterium]|nr:CRISPR system precrRNA processing endoribonuclease RAMP protein Cas6 [Deltaproteobacteria bacterium]